MDIHSEFPLQFFTNLGRADDRRQEMTYRFLEQGLAVKRQAAVDGRWLRSAKGFPEKRRSALALTKRMCLRRARVAGAKAVLLFEDDVKFHPEFRERLEEIQLPDDWGLFYLGCLHVKTPEKIVPGLVRVRHACDQHAWAVRSPWYLPIARAIRGHTKAGASGEGLFSDQRIARMQDRIPTYAAWPNLAWQDPEFHGNGNYDADGNQVRMPESECLRGFDTD